MTEVEPLPDDLLAGCCGGGCYGRVVHAQAAARFATECQQRCATTHREDYRRTARAGLWT